VHCQDDDASVPALPCYITYSSAGAKHGARPPAPGRTTTGDVHTPPLPLMPHLQDLQPPVQRPALTPHQ
jgi:hypothetical protein